MRKIWFVVLIFILEIQLLSGEMTQLVKGLPHKHEALSSITSTQAKSQLCVCTHMCKEKKNKKEIKTKTISHGKIY